MRPMTSLRIKLIDGSNQNNCPYLSTRWNFVTSNPMLTFSLNLKNGVYKFLLASDFINFLHKLDWLFSPIRCTIRF